MEHFFRVYITSSKHKGVGRIRDSYANYVAGFIAFENSPSPRVFRRGYVNMEKVLYCFYKIILKSMCESKTSQPCLHTLI